jgi:hypothetical protein
MSKNPCHRCLKTDKSIPRNATITCDTCKKNFCTKCYKKHDVHNECFCENNSKCYICGNIGFYDYSIKHSICVYHI